MAKFTKRTIVDRVATGDDIFIMEDLGNGRVRLRPDPTEVSEVGTPINAEYLQPIEDSLETAVQETREIIAGEGLIGGGDLTADRTLSINPENLFELAPMSVTSVASTLFQAKGSDIAYQFRFWPPATATLDIRVWVSIPERDYWDEEHEEAVKDVALLRVFKNDELQQSIWLTYGVHPWYNTSTSINIAMNIKFQDVIKIALYDGRTTPISLPGYGWKLTDLKVYM